MSAALSKRSQNKKNNASAQGSLKCREVSNSFWEGTRREKTRLKNVSQFFTYLVSQNKIYTFWASLSEPHSSEYYSDFFGWYCVEAFSTVFAQTSARVI